MNCISFDSHSGFFHTIQTKTKVISAIHNQVVSTARFYLSSKRALEGSTTEQWVHHSVAIIDLYSLVNLPKHIRNTHVAFRKLIDIRKYGLGDNSDSIRYVIDGVSSASSVFRMTIKSIVSLGMFKIIPYSKSLSKLSLPITTFLSSLYSFAALNRILYYKKELNDLNKIKEPTDDQKKREFRSYINSHVHKSAISREQKIIKARFSQGRVIVVNEQRIEEATNSTVIKQMRKIRRLKIAPLSSKSSKYLMVPINNSKQLIHRKIAINAISAASAATHALAMLLIISKLKNPIVPVVMMSTSFAVDTAISTYELFFLNRGLSSFRKV